LACKSGAPERFAAFFFGIGETRTEIQERALAEREKLTALTSALEPDNQPGDQIGCQPGYLCQSAAGADGLIAGKDKSNGIRSY
jgi:hypothetical protein